MTYRGSNVYIGDVGREIPWPESRECNDCSSCLTFASASHSDILEESGDLFTPRNSQPVTLDNPQTSVSTVFRQTLIKKQNCSGVRHYDEISEKAKTLEEKQTEDANTRWTSPFSVVKSALSSCHCQETIELRGQRIYGQSLSSVWLRFGSKDQVGKWRQSAHHFGSGNNGLKLPVFFRMPPPAASELRWRQKCQKEIFNDLDENYIYLHREFLRSAL